MPTPAQARAIEPYSVEVWGQGNLDTIDDIFTVDRIRHGPDLEGTSEGSAGHKELVNLLSSGLPGSGGARREDGRSGDVVLTRWSATGTLDGPMLGAAPTASR
jgi:hypothetical protein